MRARCSRNSASSLTTPSCSGRHRHVESINIRQTSGAQEGADSTPVHRENRLPFSSLRRGPNTGYRRTAIAESRQRVWTDKLQALLGVVAMNLLHIELAHEVDGFLGD